MAVLLNYRRRRDDFLAGLGGVVPKDGDATPLKAGLVNGLEADFTRGQDGLLVEVESTAAAALLDKDVLYLAASTDRNA